LAIGNFADYKVLDINFKQVLRQYELALNRFDYADSTRTIDASIYELNAAELRIKEELDALKKNGITIPKEDKENILGKFFDCLMN
jgi:hypothetical protein